MTFDEWVNLPANDGSFGGEDDAARGWEAGVAAERERIAAEIEAAARTMNMDARDAAEYFARLIREDT
jgi:hypothetical protein